ncbi:hypothetical protein CPB83DRAFT_204366 [Crepidotus variabilis]|uniref:Uncharacterized protein n=1 Tax=Crepidotus variabilis TaxID=179855 RepID=A0A9P6ETH6_9AGAR|nr:hypothetical protein CPB83DRAFT_204366 [Crepidotus variabilis]
MVQLSPSCYFTRFQQPTKLTRKKIQTELKVPEQRIMQLHVPRIVSFAVVFIVALWHYRTNSGSYKCNIIELSGYVVEVQGLYTQIDITRRTRNFRFRTSRFTTTRAVLFNFEVPPNVVNYWVLALLVWSFPPLPRWHSGTDHERPVIMGAADNLTARVKIFKEEPGLRFKR